MLNAQGVALLRLGQINESIEVFSLSINKTSAEPSLIEGMPIECWVKIMSYVDYDYVGDFSKYG